MVALIYGALRLVEVAEEASRLDDADAVEVRRDVVLRAHDAEAAVVGLAPAAEAREPDRDRKIRDAELVPHVTNEVHKVRLVIRGAGLVAAVVPALVPREARDLGRVGGVVEAGHDVGQLVLHHVVDDLRHVAITPAWWPHAALRRRRPGRGRAPVVLEVRPAPGPLDQQHRLVARLSERQAHAVLGTDPRVLEAVADREVAALRLAALEDDKRVVEDREISVLVHQPVEVRGLRAAALARRHRRRRADGQVAPRRVGARVLDGTVAVERARGHRRDAVALHVGLASEDEYFHIDRGRRADEDQVCDGVHSQP
mmetsp:Transcript_3105/g.9650  ORF Transcript_3105/g.9650 Transcript_3105/m.9650 type:complete len:313 (-) Transcript_3105:145-1083(-)